MGINKPMNDQIDELWGAGTSVKLETFATRNPTIKGTPLDNVDYRLKLESFYKKKSKALKEGHLTPKECMKTIWEEFTNLEEI
tara:strand:+ start:4590 stop:4838 length:249 start_codon:yes stop_codon:yes gene_type:complete